MSAMSDVEFSEGDEDLCMDTSPVVDNKKHARAQHNALERRRRDNIKDMYSALKDTVPGMGGERASRAVVLKKAIERMQELESVLKQVDEGNAAIEQENEEMELELARLKGQKAISSDTSSKQTSAVDEWRTGSR